MYACTLYACLVMYMYTYMYMLRATFSYDTCVHEHVFSDLDTSPFVFDSLPYFNFSVPVAMGTTSGC